MNAQRTKMCVCIHNTKNQYRYIHIKSSKDKNNKYTNTYKNIIYKSISIIGCGQFFWKKNILYANYDKPLHIQNEQKDAQQELNQDEKEAHMREYIACELMKKKALSIRKINFQQYSITEIGANIPSPNKQVQCILCDIPANALLLRDKNEIAIAVCQNHVKNQILLNDTLAHELIHLYDYARAHVDTNDPEQLACTEIRASALSGECSRIRERNRGKLTLFKIILFLYIL